LETDSLKDNLKQPGVQKIIVSILNENNHKKKNEPKRNENFRKIPIGRNVTKQEDAKKKSSRKP
jgi:hypothetical protein